MNIKSTTIIGVRRGRSITIAGDGQVTFGDMSFKQKAVKVRQFQIGNNKILGGFAGAADALTLLRNLSKN